MSTFLAKALILLSILRVLHLSVFANDFPRILIVTNLSDTGPGTLRESLANSQTNGAPVRVSSSISGTINLESPLPPITSKVWLDLTGLTLSGRSSGGAISITTNATGVRISGMSFVNLNGSQPPLINLGDLLLENCAFESNINYSATGGAILNAGDITISNCVISHNAAFGIEKFNNPAVDAYGGGIFISGGSFAIFDSIIISNKTRSGWTQSGFPGDMTSFGAGYGSGLYVGPSTGIISRTSIIGNAPYFGDRGLNGSGGGIYVSGASLRLTNCTIAGNSAHGMYYFSVKGGPAPGGPAFGGGLLVASGEAYLEHCTISENIAEGGEGGEGTASSTGFYSITPPGTSSGGGLYCVNAGLTLRACVISGNAAEFGEDIFGQFTSAGGNIIGSGQAVLGIRNDDTQNVTNVLGPLTTLNGTNWFFPLTERSVARDRIAQVSAEEDIVAAHRPIGDQSDSGSFEASPVPPIFTTQPRDRVVLDAENPSGVPVTAGVLGTGPLNWELLFMDRTLRSNSVPQFIFTTNDLPGIYRIRVSNDLGSDTSHPVQFSIALDLHFAEQPGSGFVAPGGTLILNSRAVALGSISYQWFKDGLPLKDKTNSFLYLQHVSLMDLGAYQLRAFTATESIESDPATIQFWPSIHVLNGNDDGPGSLRDAISTANSSSNADWRTILIDTPGPISLTSPLAVQSRLLIAPSGKTVTIAGTGFGRLFEVRTDAVVTLSNLVLTMGRAAPPDRGGAIWNDGETELVQCVLSNNSASLGGAIFNRGVLSMTDCTLCFNEARGENGHDGAGPGGGGAGFGGAIYIAGGSVGLTNVTVSENRAIGGAGGLSAGVPGQPPVAGMGGNTSPDSEHYAFGGGGSGGYYYTSGLYGTPVPGDHGGFGGGGGGGLFYPSIPGGGFYGPGSKGGYGGGDGPELQPGAGGGAGMGGAVFMESGVLDVIFCTITRNGAAGGSGATNGAGIAGGVFALGGQARIQNTILLGNTADLWPDFTGNIISQAGNLFSQYPSLPHPQDRVVSNAFLFPLAPASSGPLLICRPDTNSPARDNAVPQPLVGLDALGAARFQGTGPDSGAVELSGRPLFPLNIETVGDGVVHVTPSDRIYFAPGEQVLIEAVPQNDASFIEWSGGIQSRDRAVTLIMDAPLTVEARFSGPVLIAESTGGGHVRVTPARSVYSPGEQVSLEPFADSGWVFSHWSPGEGSVFDPLTIQLNSDQRITAHFEPAPDQKRPVPFSWSASFNSLLMRISPAGQPFLASTDSSGTTIFSLAPDGRTSTVCRLPEVTAVYGLAVTAHNEFALLSSSTLYFIGADGRSRWQMPISPPPLSEAFLSAGNWISVLQPYERVLSVYSKGGELLSRRTLTLGSLPAQPYSDNGSFDVVAENGDEIYLVLNGVRKVKGITWLRMDNDQFPVFFSALVVFSPYGAFKRVINLPPFLRPDRMLPVAGGFVCSGQADSNSGDPDILRAHPGFFVGRLDLAGNLDWIHLGRLYPVSTHGPYKEQSTALFTLQEPPGFSWFAFSKLDFNFGGLRYRPGFGGPEYMFQFGPHGEIRETAAVLSGPVRAVGGTASTSVLFAAPTVFGWNGASGTIPDLSVDLSEDHLQLMWPATPTPLFLQRNTNVANPFGWTDVSLSPQLKGSQYYLRLKISDRAEFFRLRQ